MTTIRVFLVDDQPDVRMLWRMWIQRANEGLLVSGEAGNAAEALATAEALEADVLVVDQMMPGMTGVELVTELRARGFDRPVILCSAYLGPEVESAAAQAGIATCLPKDRSSVLPDAIRQVAAA